MQMISFNYVDPDKAYDETRNVRIVKGHGPLNNKQFFFRELFCNDVNCDCNFAMIKVTDSGINEFANLSYGWESEKFYEKWYRKSKYYHGLSGVSTYPGPQPTLYARYIGGIFHTIIKEDEEYAKRISMHYSEFKEKTKLMIKTNRDCACKSGKKAKDCCLQTAYN